MVSIKVTTPSGSAVNVSVNPGETSNFMRQVLADNPIACPYPNIRLVYKENDKKDVVSDFVEIGMCDFLSEKYTELGIGEVELVLELEDYDMRSSRIM